MKRKEPYLNMSWPVYILIVVVGCVFAKVLFDGLGINSVYDWGNLPIVVYDILLLLYGAITCILFYLLGKTIFAKISGFDILYFNFLFIGFKKEKGKLKCYFGGKEGFSCKVEIVPNKENPNIKLAYWGGSIGLAIAIAVTYALIFSLNASATTKFFFITSSLFYVFSFLGYMLPVRMDNINDGFTLLLVRKYKLKDTYIRNKKNLKALYDSSAEIEYYDYGENNDPLSMEGKVFNYYYAIKKMDMELLKSTCEVLSNDYKFIVGEENAKIGLIARAYTLCVNEQYKELKDFFWKLDSSNRKVINNTKDLESFKVGLYMVGKVDDSREAFAELVNSIDKASKKYHYETLRENQVKIAEVVKEAILKSNEDWENPKYNNVDSISSYSSNEVENKEEEIQEVKTISLDEEDIDIEKETISDVKVTKEDEEK